jgi:cell division protein FtsW
MMGRVRAVQSRSRSVTDAGPHIGELDWLMLAVLALCCLGLVMAVSVQGPQVGPLIAMKAQGSRLLVGLVAFLLCAFTPLAFWRRYAIHLFAAATILCFVAAFFGHGANGAYRWIRIQSFQFQPVELARFSSVILCAALLVHAGPRKNTFRHGFLPVMGSAGLLATALILQPDHGNAAFVLALAACMAVVAGVRFRHFLLAGLPGLGVAVALMRDSDYVYRRIGEFMTIRPSTQVGQSLVAIASGGVAGRGLGDGWMKMGFVSEARNDFVFAAISEELGFFGSLFVLSLYAVIGYVGFRLVCMIRDPFLRYVVLGFSLVLCMQAAINLLVTTGLAPAKGIDLPFVSSGGTNLVFSLAAVGIIGNAARSQFGGVTQGRV